MSHSPAYLQIVNASAGSGKTYSLVKTYIKLLLQDEEENSDNRYAEILAMTFTNKAALEMKTRIIKALDELAYPDIHGDNYLRTIAEDTRLKKELIREKASRFLSGILHHYEDFHVMTIDKFNLRLIRSFSRDLDLPPDFEVVLNETPVACSIRLRSCVQQGAPISRDCSANAYGVPAGPGSDCPFHGVSAVGLQDASLLEPRRGFVSYPADPLAGSCADCSSYFTQSQA